MKSQLLVLGLMLVGVELIFLLMHGEAHRRSLAIKWMMKK